MAKSQKGTVSVYEADGRLRLRWSGVDAQGRPKRFSFSFGSVNRVNRLAADRLARQIEIDIVAGIFDPSLRKYTQELQERPSLSLSKLLNQFTASEVDATRSSSLERYRTLKNHLIKCFGDCPADDIEERHGKLFVEYLQDCSAETKNMYLTLLRYAWKWAIKRGLLRVNPWLDLSVKASPAPPPNPFSLEEVQLILSAFDGNYYHDFVTFLFGTGCRIGEAIALTWDAINDDCSEVWFGRSFDARAKVIKTTKTNKARIVPVSLGIQKLLQSKRQDGVKGTDLVFPNPKGLPIDRENFLRRHWKPIFKSLSIPYRSPYNSRHTRWSHELAGGMDLATACLYAGNRPRTMLNRYLGAVQRPRLKDWD